MNHAQVMAAKIVIGKSIPDLKVDRILRQRREVVQRRMIVEFVSPKGSNSET